MNNWRDFSSRAAWSDLKSKPPLRRRAGSASVKRHSPQKPRASSVRRPGAAYSSQHLFVSRRRLTGTRRAGVRRAEADCAENTSCQSRSSWPFLWFFSLRGEKVRERLNRGAALKNTSHLHGLKKKKKRNEEETIWKRKPYNTERRNSIHHHRKLEALVPGNIWISVWVWRPN